MQNLRNLCWQRCGSLNCGYGNGSRAGLPSSLAAVPCRSTVARLDLRMMSQHQSKASPRIINVPAGHRDKFVQNQRLNRPVAPHLSAYKVGQTYLGTSAWMRITGCTLSGASYLYFLGYLAAPLFGATLDSAALVSGFQALPAWGQTGLKMFIAFPFAYHFINGVKQLFYDMGFMFERKNIIRADRFLWISSFLTSLGIVYYL